MDIVRGFIKITRAYGFNYLATPVGEVSLDQELFLRRKGAMISLGTYSQARARIGGGERYVLGIDGTNYGDFGTPEIDDNLFISANPRLPPPGQRNIPTLQTFGKQALSYDDYEALKAYDFPPPNKITYSDGSNQNAGNFKRRKSRSRKYRSRKSRSRKSRSRRSRSRKSRSI